MTLSMIVPFMDIDKHEHNLPMTKHEMLHRMLDSCTGYDEVLLIENEGAGFAVPVNFGLQEATGDFLLVANDDMIWDGGDLKRICDPDAVVSPQINESKNRFSGVAFCMPKKVYKKIGGLWEGYKIAYFEDCDYYQMIIKAGFRTYCNEEVKTTHEGQNTIRKYFKDAPDFYKINEKLYVDRWGHGPDF